MTEPALVANIPLDVRNPLQEVNFTVGVTQSNSLTAGTNASTQSTTNTFYISGTKEGESDIMIDGATDAINYDTHAASDIPVLDAVREFRIYTLAYSPEFGHTGGGIESFTIKSAPTTCIEGVGSITAPTRWMPMATMPMPRTKPSLPFPETSLDSKQADR